MLKAFTIFLAVFPWTLVVSSLVYMIANREKKKK